MPDKSEGRHPPLIMVRGARVGLGPLRRDLNETYQRWMSDLRVLRTLGAANLPMTLESEDSWLDHSLTDRSGVHFTVYELDRLRPIGNTGFHEVNWPDRSATFGIVIGEVDAWNRGYGTETCRLMLEYGFDVLGLQNIMLETMDINPGGLTAYERAGFKRIGVRRNAVQVGRERVNMVLMDAVPDDVPASNLHHLLQTGEPA